MEYAETYAAAIDQASKPTRRSTIGGIAFDIASRESPVWALVDDDAIVSARAALWSDHRVPAEHGGATAYAALIADAYVPEDGEGVGIVVCGANTDVRTLDPQPVQHRAATRMARAMMAVYPTAFNHGSRIVPINRVQGRTWLVRA